MIITINTNINGYITLYMKIYLYSMSMKPKNTQYIIDQVKFI